MLKYADLLDKILLLIVIMRIQETEKNEENADAQKVSNATSETISSHCAAVRTFA